MKIHILCSIILLVLLGTLSCRTQQVTQSEITAFVDDYESRAEFLKRQLALQGWKNMSSSLADSLDFYQKAQTAFLGDPERFSKLQRYAVAVDDGRYQRKLELIQRKHLRTVIDYSRPIKKMTDSLAAVVDGQRFDYNGRQLTRLELTETLGSEPNRFRREEIYNVLTGMGQDVADGLGTLARMRNQAAVRLGYNSYYDLMLKADGIDREAYWGLLDDLEELSAGAYRKGLDSLRGSLNLTEMHIGDIDYAEQQLKLQYEPYYGADRQLRALKNTFKGIGVSLDATPIYYTVNMLSEGSTASVFDIHTPNDIRVVIELKNGRNSMDRLFRKTGRAIYLANIDQREFLFSGPPAPCFDEAMAHIFSGLIDLDGWKQKYGGLPAPAVSELATAREFFRLYYLRLMLVQLRFERELYRKPFSDLDRIYGQIFQELMMFPCSVEQKPWALQTEYISDPVGLQNRLIASCIAAQTYNYLVVKYGSILDNQHTREFLVQNFYRFGCLEDWTTLLERGTGEKLRAEYYLEYGGI
ncbi:MAG: hypothetical protein GY841_02270 [FCB group bacterium]|nr:hypothetical protein [FCB group bacterium]